MRTVTTQLAELLDSGRPHFRADLWTITLSSGAVARYTSADVDLVWGGALYSAHGPIISRGSIRHTLGLETDTLDVTISANDDHLLAGRPWLLAARLGVLDGAKITLSRLYAEDWTSPTGVMGLFSGEFGEIDDLGINELKFRVNSVTALLDVQMPRDVYSPTCTHVIYSARCGLNRALHAVPAIVGNDASYIRIPCDVGGANGTYNLGEVEIVNGDMAGLTASIRLHADGVLTLASPLPQVIAAGTSIRVYPGCDGTRARCVALGNSSNFRGFPLVPTPESIL